MRSNKNPLLKLIGAAAPLVFVAIVAFAGSPKTGMTPVKFDSPENAMHDGGSDYATYCAKCHGGDGRAQTAKGKRTNATDLTKSSISDAKGIRIITNGRGEMPEFKSNMSAAQINGVMNYIKRFR